VSWFILKKFRFLSCTCCKIGSKCDRHILLFAPSSRGPWRSLKTCFKRQKYELAHCKGLWKSIITRRSFRLYWVNIEYSSLVRGYCGETTLTGESRFHISTPQGIWTWVPCGRKLTGSPLDQWDMVRMKWDCRLFTELPPPQQPTPSVVKLEGGTPASLNLGQKSCVI
jgi:hypothetical protein